MNFIPDYIMDVVIKYVDNKHLYDCCLHIQIHPRTKVQGFL